MKKKRARPWMAAAGVALCLVIGIFSLWIPVSGEGRFLVLRGLWGTPPNIRCAMMAREYTEDVLFDPAEDFDIFRGTVLRTQNITVVLEDQVNHWCLVTVRVKRCYQGDLTEGGIARILVEFPLTGDPEPMGSNLTYLRKGTEGIFLPDRIGEDGCMGVGNSSIRLWDLADGSYPLKEGIIKTGTAAFVQVEDHVRYDGRCFGNAGKILDLDDAEAYVLDRMAEYSGGN